MLEQAEAAQAMAMLHSPKGLPMLFTLDGSNEQEISAKKIDGSKDCWNSCDYPSECRWGKQFGVQTPQLPITVTVPSMLDTIEEAEPEPTRPELSIRTSFDDILLDAPTSDGSTASKMDIDTHRHQTNLTSPEKDEKKPALDDLLESAKRRKRRSAGALPSPLGSNLPSPDWAEATAQTLQKALDDFEVDLRKSFERAGDAVTSFVGGMRSSGKEDEKAEAFVKGLKVGKKNSAL